jgi:hypothetical protein
LSTALLPLFLRGERAAGEPLEQLEIPGRPGSGRAVLQAVREPDDGPVEFSASSCERATLSVMARSNRLNVVVSVVAGVLAGGLAGRMWAWQCTDAYLKVCRAGYWSWPWFFGVGLAVGCAVSAGTLKKLRSA